MMKSWLGTAILTGSVFLMVPRLSQADVIWTFSDGGGDTTLVTFSGSTSSPSGQLFGFQGSYGLPFDLFDGGFVFGPGHGINLTPIAIATDIGTTFVGSVSGAHTLLGGGGSFDGINFSGEDDDPGADNVSLDFNGAFSAGETITASGAISIDFPFSTILATGSNPFSSLDGGSHAIVVSPIPEPSTFILTTLGLLSLGMTRRRRRR